MPESPSYYTRGNIEVWDFIRDQELPYHLGNAIKYVCRAGYKGAATKTQDLKKAIHYLENELQHTLPESESVGPSGSFSYSLWDYELDGEPDYATGFDR
jgi:hypothetical protein